MSESAVPRVRKSVTNVSVNELRIPCKSGRALELSQGETINLKLDEVDEQTLAKLAAESRIAVEDYEERFVINNRTPYRIAICKKICAPDDEEKLVIPAFGAREVSLAERAQYNTNPWEQANLVQVRSTDQRINRPAGNLLILFCSFMFGAAMVIALVHIFWMKIVNFLQLPAHIGDKSEKYAWLAVVLISLLIYIFKVFGRKRELLRQAGQWVIGLITFTIGIGLPGFVIFWNYDGQQLVFSYSLAQFVQFVFIGLASVTPAALFFLFDRQRVRTLRDSFFREVTRLDPQIKSLDDAESIYGARVNEAYGAPVGNSSGTQSGNFYGDSDETLSSRLISSKRLPVIIATILVTSGWLLVLRMGKTFESSGDAMNFFQPNASLIAFGFLGSYFFGLNMLFRRYARSDLKPKAYSHLVVRILTVTTICLVLTLYPSSAIQEIAKDNAGSAGTAGTNNLVNSTNPPAKHSNKPVPATKHSDNGFDFLLIFAFIIGIFPETGVNFIAETLRERKFFRKVVPSLKEKQSLSALEGISLYDRTRLMEEGVENIENLAHHDLIDLIVHTRIPVPRLVDWVDQAILYLHLGVDNDFEDAGDDKAATAADADVGRRHLQVLKQNGIRNATGLERAFQRASDEKLFLGMLAGSNGGPPPLEVIMNAIKGEQWMSNIRWWRLFGDQKDVTFDLDKFQNPHNPD